MNEICRVKVYYTLDTSEYNNLMLTNYEKIKKKEWRTVFRKEYEQDRTYRCHATSEYGREVHWFASGQVQKENGAVSKQFNQHK